MTAPDSHRVEERVTSRPTQGAIAAVVHHLGRGAQLRRPVTGSPPGRARIHSCRPKSFRPVECLGQCQLLLRAGDVRDTRRALKALLPRPRPTVRRCESTIAAMSNEWPIPDDLSADGRRAAEAIHAFLVARDMSYHGGGGRFYSPQMWKDRGERYGTESLLVITHDGGDHACAFNLDYGAHAVHEELQNRLGELGMFVEAATSWYSSVYPL